MHIQNYTSHKITHLAGCRASEASAGGVGAGAEAGADVGCVGAAPAASGTEAAMGSVSGGSGSAGGVGAGEGGSGRPLAVAWEQGRAEKIGGPVLRLKKE